MFRTGTYLAGCPCQIIRRLCALHSFFRIMHDLFVNQAYLVRRLGLFFVVGAPAPTPIGEGVHGGTVDGVVGAFGLNYLIFYHINCTWFNIYHIRAKGFNLPYPLKKKNQKVNLYRCLWICNEKIPVYLVWDCLEATPTPSPLWGGGWGVVDGRSGAFGPNFTLMLVIAIVFFSIFNY